MWHSVVAHVLPVQHAEGADAFLTITLLTGGVLATVLLGLFLGRRAQRSTRRRHLAVAYVAGILLYLLFDLLKESASLGQGLLRNPALILQLLLAFIAGTFLLGASGTTSAPTRIVWAWSAGIGLHGAAEGWIIGTEATVAVLSPTGTASFLLHKALEGLTIPLVANHAPSRNQLLGASLIITGAALTGAIAGLLVGPSTLPLVFFAGGAGATALAILHAAQRAAPTNRVTLHGLVLGVLTMFAAGVLHEI